MNTSATWNGCEKNFSTLRARATLLPRYLAIHERLRRDASSSAADAVAELLSRPS